MSVVGIDFGNSNAVIAVARNRGIDVICNDVSNRATPCLVSFGQKQRYLGESAKTMEISNFKNTIGSLKRLLGRSFADEEVQKVEKNFINADLCDVDGALGVKVFFQDEQKTFTFTQLCAMYFSKLKDITEAETKAPMSDCVISIPNYYTDAQRRALLDAAEIAGVNILRMMPDTSAAALQWGITKTDLPENEPRNVVFVDLGQSDYTVTVVAFQKGKMMVKGLSYDRNLGGRDFDQILADHFVAEFKEKYRMNIAENPKALFRLRSACERVKKMLSANAQAPISVECLMNEKDVSGLVERATFEALAEPLLERLHFALEKALAAAGLSKEEIYCVEIIGGSTRIPCVKQRISSFFGKELHTTLNMDECTSKGCALMCATISPVFQVRDFKVEDVLPFPIKLTWDLNESGAEKKELKAFSSLATIPCTKLLSFYRKEPFDIEASYAEAEMLPPGANSWICRYSIAKVKPNSEGGPSTVKVKVRINPNGILEITGAQSIEEKAAPPSDAAPAAAAELDKALASTEKAPAADDDSAVDAMDESKDENADPKSPASAVKSPTADAKAPPPKKIVVKVDLPVSGTSTALPADKVTALRELENAMNVADKLVIDTEERRNALETYVYEMRTKLGSSHSDYIDEKTKEKFLAQLNECEEWLYTEEGESSTKSVYANKLKEFEAIGGPVDKRYREADERSSHVESFRSTISGLLAAATSGDAKYEHIPAADLETVAKECQEKLNWLDAQHAQLAKLPKHVDAPFTNSGLAAERDAVAKRSNAVLNRPKPTPPPPEVKPTSPTAGATADPTATTPEDATATEKADQPAPSEPNPAAPATEASPMDVDEAK